MRGVKNKYTKDSRLNEKRGIFSAIATAEQHLARPILIAHRIVQVDDEWKSILEQLEKCKEELVRVRHLSEDLTLAQTNAARIYRR